MIPVEEANVILEDMYKPSGDEDWFIAYRKHPERFRGFNIENLRHLTEVYLAQMITKEVLGNVNERYTVMPVQAAIDLLYSDKKFKKDACYWFHNRELILESGLIIPDPRAKVYEGRLEYMVEMTADEGKLKPLKPSDVIKVKIDTNDIVETLVNAGVMKKPDHKILSEGIHFKDGLSVPISSWDRDKRRFEVSSIGPLRGSKYQLGVFKKITSS